jgi:hypothetical protein
MTCPAPSRAALPATFSSLAGTAGLTNTTVSMPVIASSVLAGKGAGDRSGCDGYPVLHGKRCELSCLLQHLSLDLGEFGDVLLDQMVLDGRLHGIGDAQQIVLCLQAMSATAVLISPRVTGRAAPVFGLPSFASAAAWSGSE